MSKILDEKLEKMSKGEQNLWALRHTAEHVLHAAMQNLYPSLKKAMGPATPEGFYFDFELGKKISEDDFPRIEKEMKRIIDLDLPMIQEHISADKAKSIFKNNPYKIEWVKEIKKRKEKVSIYKMGDVDVDLCSGPHAKSTGKIKAFKLLSVAGAYWHGDEKNKMLTRIYGTCFPTSNELEAYVKNIEEAKKRDHKKLSQELDLIVFSDLVGSGLPLYTPKGALLRSTIFNYSRELNEEIGYKETALPSVNRAELFKISGHYEKYRGDMFMVSSHYSDEEYFLKPMNCPQHCVIYKSRARSYKDLPVRFSDFSVLYRDEKPGEINGLFRTRSFTQDDGHCFCREDQIGQEFENVMKVIDKALKTYGFKYWIRLSLRDPKDKGKYLGDDKVWKRAETKLREIVVKSKMKYKEALGEAAIYGPKLDFMAEDSLGREWQISTVQLDMIMPVRFGLEYTDADGSKKTPFMVHRAIIGSERFMAILIENYAGNFPTWLSPVQVKVLPITENHLSYAKKVAEELNKSGIRVEIDGRNERLQAKIRDAQIEKVPYMFIVGGREEEAKAVAVRKRDGKDLGSLNLQDFIKVLKKEIEEKKLD